MKPNPKPVPNRNRVACLFPWCFGFLLGLTLLKFGNPPIMEQFVTAPGDIYEFLLGYPWPIHWSYWLLGLVVLMGVAAAKPLPRAAPRWLVLLPLAWLIWQWLAGIQSLDPHLSRLTLMHLTVCVACFYLGLFSFNGAHQVGLWVPLGASLCIVLALGFEQHFGGLEETRRYFYLYLYPKLSQPPPPEYLKKLSSTRIFGTLFYPNALAGALLLLLPPVTALILRTPRMTSAARTVLAGIILGAGLCCLVWSGSKGGWLLMLVLAVIALLHLPGNRRLKLGVVVALALVGMALFGLKYAAFFRRGATSVVARFDYWRAAIQTAAEHPVFGTGPGTFAIPYQRIKRPESEMSRLVHNDYLEQASDSGWLGFMLYSGFIVSVLWLTRPGSPGSVLRTQRQEGESLVAPAQGMDWVRFATWLGVLGWALQGLMEFGLYIPALAWPAWGFLGWLLKERSLDEPLKSVDKAEVAALPSARK